MIEKKMNIKSLKDIKSSSILNNANKEEFEIPYEAACSPEFAQGCILPEDEED